MILLFRKVFIIYCSEQLLTSSGKCKKKERIKCMYSMKKEHDCDDFDCAVHNSISVTPHQHVLNRIRVMPGQKLGYLNIG
jgi:hypothetical protein